MKARDHGRILRRLRTELLADMEQNHHNDLVRVHNYFDGEMADRQRVIDNYANAIDRLDGEVRVLTDMLLQRGVDIAEIDKHVGAELARLKLDEEEITQ